MTQSSRLIAIVRDALPPLIAFCCVIAVWEAACAVLAIPTFVLPAPSAIAFAGSSVGLEMWTRHIVATLRVVLSGFAIAVVLAIPIAMVFVASPLLSRAIYPLVVIVQSVPVVSVAPIIIVLFGTSEPSRIVITSLIAFFPVIVAAVAGMSSTPTEMVELSRSMRAGRLREILGVRFPHALPQVFGALKVSMTLAVIGATVAEFVASDVGLGYLIMLNTSFLRMGQAFSALAVLVAASLILFWIVAFAERRIVHWALSR